MKSKTIKRLIAVTLIVVVALGAAASLGLHFATSALKSQVEQALGPESEVAEIVVGWSAIELRGMRIRAPKGWPAEDALRAERIVVKPDLLGLISARVHVPRISVEKAYVSVLRARDGKVHLLPSLMEAPARDGGQKTSTALPVSIGTIELHDGVMEFFDATVRQPAHKTRLDQLHARIDDLQLPALNGRTRIQLDGSVKGVNRNGKVMIDGWAEVADKNSEITTKLQGVDMVALQPYLIKASETGVRRGTLDLKLKSTVRNNRLHAPGTVTLTGLELAPGQGPFGTFMGVPRQAVVAALKNRNGQISIDFTLEGNLNDPQFSLNDSFARRVGSAVAETLGISLEGLTRGVGGAAEGIGGVVKKLFRK
ncbi:DUF748 domain-containing protein [Herbaspirillum sp. ST 5-3]|uniref:DUF748 domain-containing protein n=1 Tax=Oxalobacteraceae TaxID=75682 RepID=UPI0010A3491E|nr:DUF748 domain-containing protein [Herbaspirillum sp. ST 5-3]